MKKAAELQRLMDVRGCAMALTSVAKPVICLEIAAFGLNIPVDKNVAIRLSGMTKKAYIHAFKTIECVLGKQKELTIKDLAVQFGCMEASNLAHQIYLRYKEAFVKDVEDISHPIFVATALFTACKHQKIKVDKTKLLNLLATKRSTFDSLHKKMEKVIPTLESAVNNKRTSKRSYGFLDKVNEIVEDQSHSSKLSKTDEEATDREDRDKEYEEWKQKIIESATKALSAGKKTVEKQKS